MNTRILLTACALSLAIGGAALLFVPDFFAPEPSGLVGFLPYQLLGALYLGFAGINWMSRYSPIGGIYQRPLVVGNFTHFLVGGLLLIKLMVVAAPIPTLLWIPTGLYLAFSAAFSWLLFHGPVKP